MAALRTRQSVAKLHFLKAREQSGLLTLVDQAVKLCDSGRSANENLNPARIARYVRLVLLGQPDFPNARANRTRELEFCSCHHIVASHRALL